MKLRAQDIATAQELLGYINFSSGRPDVAFQRAINEFIERVGWSKAPGVLLQVLDDLQASSPAFRNAEQARHVITLVFDRLWGAYQRHHADMLFHLTDADLQQPLLAARFFEAVLQQGPPWDEADRLVEQSLASLNDFLGYRPVPVLENGRRMEPYPHELFRPIPLYIRGVGPAHGPYHAVIQRALEMLEESPPDILSNAYFQLDLLDELALDVRAHDHLHPANRRTNYLFGEWDPHVIDLKGRYRRFVLRKVILDALLSWMAEQKRTAAEEVLFDAAAVLCGTILMASSISGSGPDSHDSTMTLNLLLPKVARQRDQFYARLLSTATGARAKRLQRHAKATQQPFGHVRQHLNLHLAQYGAQQVQRRQLAYIYARMGYAAEARQQAAVIPCSSARFECEIQWRITAIRYSLERHDLAQSVQLQIEAEDLFHRGIHCGALVDPWNILGFGGQFPLFHSRDDSVPDQRIEVLLELAQDLLDASARVLAEAAATGQTELSADVERRFARFGEFWDQFATTTVSDLPRVHGGEALESARRVARALGEWRRAGAEAGQISFWRQHVEHFRSTKSYAQVVEALLARRDLVASLGLLMQWLSEADEVGLEVPGLSFESLMLQWMGLACGGEGAKGISERWQLVQRMFDVLEANAGELWSAPLVNRKSPVDGGGLGASSLGEGAATDEEEDNLFRAAYEGVVYRDSTDDGHDGEVADDGPTRGGDTPFEQIELRLEPRLRFLQTLAQLWQQGAVFYATQARSALQTGASELVRLSAASQLETWRGHAERLQQSLLQLLDDLAREPVAFNGGNQDANIEYDIQVQTKVALLQHVITTVIGCRVAGWLLQAAIPHPQELTAADVDEHRLLAVLRGLLSGDPAAVQKALPPLLRTLKKKPLLYVPLDHGGQPGQMLAARSVQAVLRLLVGHLPRLGLLKETWQLLQAARAMERTSRPQGLVVTEFDRLFRVALRRSLESVVDASEAWKAGRFSDEDLVEMVGTIVENYLEIWLGHSSTMRLSTVEALRTTSVWEGTCDFIHKYGADLLHARQLTLGNIRSILHQGVENHLKQLEEDEDPLRPILLLEDIRNQVLTLEDAVESLQLIYQIVVEKFDRFLEYNTTTTQSDYGEQFHTLLDFLRVETGYDRDAWNYLPLLLAHEVLARRRRESAAVIWEDVFEVKTEPEAEAHLEALAKLQKQHGMRLPGLTSHLEERFVRPLEVNHMLSLIGPACAAIQRGELQNESFTQLSKLVEKYLSQTLGSGLDIPPWLRHLQDEMEDCLHQMSMIPREREPEIPLPPANISLRELRLQLRQWKDQPGGRGKPKS